MREDRLFAAAPGGEEESAPLVGKGEEKKLAHVESFVLGTSWAVVVRHSRMYVVLSVLQIVLSSSALIWVAVDHSALHKSGFIFLEILIILSLFFDTILQVHLQGPRKFFFGPNSQVPSDGLDNPQTDGSADVAKPDGEQIDTWAGAFVSFWKNYSFVLINYGQLVILVFSIVGVATTLSVNALDWEEDLAFALLLARYVLLLGFFTFNYCRTASAQGGVMKACCSGEEEVDEAWDVKF